MAKKKVQKKADTTTTMTKVEVFEVDIPEHMQTVFEAVEAGTHRTIEQKEKLVMVPNKARSKAVKVLPGTLPTWYREPVYAEQMRRGFDSIFSMGISLFGPRGSWKTISVKYEIGVKLGYVLIIMQCAKGMSIDDLKGTWRLVQGETGGTVMEWEDGVLAIAARMALKNIKVCVVLEECNTLDPGTLSALNTLADRSGVPLRLQHETIAINSDCLRFALLFNEGFQYAGTNEVNAALKDRLRPVFACYPPEVDEVHSLHVQTSAPEIWCRRVVRMANAIRNHEDVEFDLSMRALGRMIEDRIAGLPWYRPMNIKDHTWPISAFSCSILDLIGDPQVHLADRIQLETVAKQEAGLEGWDNEDIKAGLSS